MRNLAPEREAETRDGAGDLEGDFGRDEVEGGRLIMVVTTRRGQLKHGFQKTGM